MAYRSVSRWIDDHPDGSHSHYSHSRCSGFMCKRIIICVTKLQSRVTLRLSNWVSSDNLSTILFILLSSLLFIFFYFIFYSTKKEPGSKSTAYTKINFEFADHVSITTVQIFYLLLWYSKIVTSVSKSRLKRWYKPVQFTV